MKNVVINGVRELLCSEELTRAGGLSHFKYNDILTHFFAINALHIRHFLYSYKRVVNLVTSA